MNTLVRSLYPYLTCPVCDTGKLADRLINQSFTAHWLHCMRKWKLEKIIWHFDVLKIYWIPLLFSKPQWLDWDSHWFLLLQNIPLRRCFIRPHTDARECVLMCAWLSPWKAVMTLTHSQYVVLKPKAQQPFLSGLPPFAKTSVAAHSLPDPQNLKITVLQEVLRVQTVSQVGDIGIKDSAAGSPLKFSIVCICLLFFSFVSHPRLDTEPRTNHNFFLQYLYYRRLSLQYLMPELITTQSWCFPIRHSFSQNRKIINELIRIKQNILPQTKGTVNQIIHISTLVPLFLKCPQF